MPVRGVTIPKPCKPINLGTVTGNLYGTNEYRKKVILGALAIEREIEVSISSLLGLVKAP